MSSAVSQFSTFADESNMSNVYHMFSVSQICTEMDDGLGELKLGDKAEITQHSTLYNTIGRGIRSCQVLPK